MKRFLRILIYAALCLLAVPMMAAVSLMLDAGPPWLLLILAVIALACWYWSKRAPIDQDQPMRSPPVPPPFPAMARAVAKRKQPQRPPPAAASRQRPAQSRTRRNTGRGHQGGHTQDFAHGHHDWHDDPAASAHTHFQGHQEEDPHGHDRFFDELRESARGRMEAEFREHLYTQPDPFERPAGFEPAEELGKWMRGDPPYDHHRD